MNGLDHDDGLDHDAFNPFCCCEQCARQYTLEQEPPYGDPIKGFFDWLGGL